jgi:ATP-dependent protease ClpP protease subunit
MEQRFQSLQPTADLPKLHAILAAREPKEGQEGRGWYTIINLSQSEAEVMIYDEIGAWGITAGDFTKELRALKASTITLRINSPGGDVFDGVAIYNAISRHPATVNGYVDGIAASAASFIAMASDTLMMAPHSQMMIHEAHGLVIGPADDMRKMADILDKSSDNIAGIYAEKAGGTIEDWRARMREETWLSDHEAVEMGLADGIEGEEEEMAEARAAAKLEAAKAVAGVAIAAAAAIEPEPEQPPEPPDFLKMFQEVVEEETDAIYAGF